MKIAIATDHTGYEILKELTSYIETKGHECIGYGPVEFNAEDDYPDFIVPAARAVADGECKAAIILGGSGQGEAMAANHIPGIRAAVFYGPVVAKVSVDAEGRTSEDPYEIVKLSRQHNDSNVLSLSARFMTVEEMKQALSVWLDTPFSGAERHVRRIKKMETL